MHSNIVNFNSNSLQGTHHTERPLLLHVLHRVRLCYTQTTVNQLRKYLVALKHIDRLRVRVFYHKYRLIHTCTVHILYVHIHMHTYTHVHIRMYNALTCAHVHVHSHLDVHIHSHIRSCKYIMRLYLYMY